MHFLGDITFPAFPHRGRCAQIFTICQQVSAGEVLAEFEREQ